MASSNPDRSLVPSRRTAKVGGWLGASASTASLLALLGCGGLGDRAMTGCPEGEVCSDATPDGLRFFGASIEGTLSNTAQPMAVGGTQSLRFQDARSATRALPPHTTVSSAPGVIEVVTSSNGAAVLRAASQGEARVRVIEPSGPLLDRITVRAHPLDRVSLAHPLFANPTRDLAYVPGMRSIGVALRAADGTRLVDESLVLMDATVDVTTVAGRWDGFELQVPTEGATLTVTTAGRTFDVAVPAAGAIDDIVVNPFLLGTMILPSVDPLRVEEGGILCFDLLSSDRVVIGSDATCTYRIDGVLVDGSDTFGCVGMPEMLGDTVTVEVSAAGLTRTFVAGVEPRTDTMALVSSGSFVLPTYGQLGERATRLRGLPVRDLPMRDLPMFGASGLGI
jgi:hypothetical protein